MIQNHQPQKPSIMPRYVGVKSFMNIKRDKRRLYIVLYHFPGTKHPYDDFLQALRTLYLKSLIVNFCLMFFLN